MVYSSKALSSTKLPTHSFLWDLPAFISITFKVSKVLSMLSISSFILTILRPTKIDHDILSLEFIFTSHGRYFAKRREIS